MIYESVVRRGLATALSAVLAASSAAPLSAQSLLDWHAYTQIRYARSSDSSGFSLRRAKLWASGPVPGVGGLSFKAQGIFRDGAQGAFVLQDLYVEYRTSPVSVRVGQMVPDFSLQRSQPDYRIPLVERAGVVDAVIPGASTLARDIGVQVSVAPGPGALHVSAGIFNGTGADRLNTDRGNFLATTRATLTRALRNAATVTVGGSFEMRSSDGLRVGVLSPTGAPFVGHEYRWGLEGHVVGPRWTLQGEYLEAHLGGASSRGFYLLGTYALSSADEAVLSVEQLRTPSPDVPNAPWYIVGFDHSLSAPRGAAAVGGHLPDGGGGAMPTKLMADMRLRSVGSSTEYAATLQLQLFVH